MSQTVIISHYRSARFPDDGGTIMACISEEYKESKHKQKDAEYSLLQGSWCN